MKGVVSLIYFSLMSVYLITQAPIIISSLPILSNLESVVNICIQNEDKCLEDQFAENWNEAIFFPPAEWLTSDLSVNNICGIMPFKWQPPE